MAARAQDWTAVDAAMGRVSVAQANAVHRYNFPRGDMHVVVNGVAIAPPLALGGWVAMKSQGIDGAVMAMGDLVLADSEVEPVIARLQDGGVEQTAIHHHLLHESPRVLYMHVHAFGNPVQIAQTIRAAMALTAAPAPTPAPPAMNVMAPVPFAIDTAAIGQIIGVHGSVNGGVYQVGVPRAEEIRDGDVVIPPNMGLATSLNFQPTTLGKAAITGDFVLLGSEVNPVIRALRANGIEVTSLHSHLIGETPTLYFMHFWANDDALKLARGLKAALDLTNSRR